MRGSGRNKCLHGSGLSRAQPIGYARTKQGVPSGAAQQKTLQAAHDRISSYISVNVPHYVVFRREHGNSTSLHTYL